MYTHSLLKTIDSFTLEFIITLIYCNVERYTERKEPRLKGSKIWRRKTFQMHLTEDNPCRKSPVSVWFSSRVEVSSISSSQPMILNNSENLNSKSQSGKITQEHSRTISNPNDIKREIIDVTHIWQLFKMLILLHMSYWFSYCSGLFESNFCPCSTWYWSLF